MIVIATLFWKVQTVKDLVRPLSKKHRFRTPFDSQHVKGSQTVSDVVESTFIIFLITLREPGLEYTTLSDMLNLWVDW